MSKKSRKRNKKILAALALAGGAAMMGRGKGSPAADVDSGRGGDSTSSKARAANIIRGQFPFKNTDPILHGGVGVKHSPRRKVWTGKQSGDLSSGMFYTPEYKKGGRVTGIAKRGFGRALMKGKK